MKQSDHELMRRSAAGDAAAFETLVRRWEAPLRRILRRLTEPDRAVEPGRVGPESDVADLSQEVFLRVLSAADRYTNNCAFSTWLYRIALNVSRDAARRRTSRWRRLRDRQPSEAGRSPDEDAGRRELKERINEALAALPEKLREPVVLKHFGELTFAELAEVLRVPVSTAKSRVQAGLLQLRSELKARGVDEQDL